MKFKYIGDNDSLTMYGIEFKNGVETDVPKDLIAYHVRIKGVKTAILAVNKFKGHPEFSEVKEMPELTRQMIINRLTEQDVKFSKYTNTDTLLGLLNDNTSGNTQPGSK